MQKQKQEYKLKNDNFKDAVDNAVDGIVYTTKTQSNFRKHLIIITVLLIISLFLDLSKAEFLCLVLSLALVVFAELINTAVETVVDLYIDIYHPKAKIAKDVAAGAVVVAAITSVFVGCYLFYEKIYIAGIHYLSNAKASIPHMIFVAIMITVIGVTMLKGSNIIKKTFLRKVDITKISGISAISFSILTAIWLISDNILVTALSIVMSTLVLGAKLENKGYTIAEGIFSGFFGITITLLTYMLCTLS